MSTQKILADSRDKMKKGLEFFKDGLKGLRTGRVSPALVEHVRVDAYGSPLPLNQVASISVPEPRMLVVKPFDPSMCTAIEKGILKSDVGLTPNVDGTVVRLSIPPLTEERRRDLVKLVHKRMEEARVEIRNLRRDAADHLKKLEREGEVGTDEGRKLLEELQRTTDRHVADVDRVGAAKEQEVLEV